MANPLMHLAGFVARRIPVPLKQRLYRLGPLTQIIRRLLNQAMPSGLTEIKVASGGAAGAHLRLDLRREKDYWLGTYELDVQRALSELIRPGDVAYDVGANIGYLTLLMARLVGGTGHVFAFEALPDNLERLQSHLELNGATSRVTVISGAVIDRAGHVRFLVGPSSGTGKVEGSAGRLTAYPESISVNGLALDEFVFQAGNPPPAVMKIDIEGGEILALKGMTRLLHESRPSLLLELHGPESARRVWELLKGAGYGIHRMDPGYTRVSGVEALDWKAYLAAWPESIPTPIRTSSSPTGTAK